ncbi:MAG: hypothetical protein HOV79_21100 [Hamadaea sp.]|nr:hypothetical protein [Hamadaea sp.]
MIFRRDKDVVRVAQDLVGAVERRDEKACNTSMQALGNAAATATPEQAQQAMLVLLPLLQTLPLGAGASIAQAVGALAGSSTDPLVPLAVLVEGAASAMEKATGLVEAYAQLGHEPHEDDPAEAVERLTRERDRLGLTEQAAYELAEAFHAGGDWVQPVLFLCQRKDVRRALPQRERLTRAIEAMADYVETAHWLKGLLHVLDDEPVVVLHRATGTGFRLRISGIGDNFQLHTQLAAHLIGDVPGEPLSPAEIAAADDGDMMPPGGLSGRFNLVDAFGQWIWNEGRPSDIPTFDGVRVVVLDPPPYRRRWTAGRAYPLMKPEVIIEQRLTAEQSRELLARMAPAAATGAEALEPVVSDDLSLRLGDRSYGELVDFVLAGMLAGQDGETIAREVADAFGLSLDDGALAWDRTGGGLVRAATASASNEPDRDKDPVAWESYQRGKADPSLLRRTRGVIG